MKEEEEEAREEAKACRSWREEAEASMWNDRNEAKKKKKLMSAIQ